MTRPQYALPTSCIDSARLEAQVAPVEQRHGAYCGRHREYEYRTGNANSIGAVLWRQKFIRFSLCLQSIIERNQSKDAISSKVLSEPPVLATWFKAGTFWQLQVGSVLAITVRITLIHGDVPSGAESLLHKALRSISIELNSSNAYGAESEPCDVGFCCTALHRKALLSPRTVTYV